MSDSALDRLCGSRASTSIETYRLSRSNEWCRLHKRRLNQLAGSGCVNATQKTALLRALQQQFGAPVAEDLFQRAEEEYDNFSQAMQGCGSATSTVAYALFGGGVLNTALLFFGKRPLFEGSQFTTFMLIATIGLTLYGATCVVMARLRQSREDQDRISIVIEELKEFKMGETNINTGQAGNVGSKGHAHDFDQTQYTGGSEGKFDLNSLSNELSTLLPTLASRASTSDQYQSTSEIAKARDAAAGGDHAGTMKSLANAGKWALGVAQDIGVKLAEDALSSALNLK